jgi:hypothetical protein
MRRGRSLSLKWIISEMGRRTLACGDPRMEPGTSLMDWKSKTKQWGLKGDIPLIGDYDGDGKTDVTVWRPSIGYWFIIQSSTNKVVQQQFGLPTDVPVPGDYDGDGKTDIAVWRPSNGFWYIIQSSTHKIVSQQFGLPTDIPVPGDYDGDGKTDIAVWRPSTGMWYIIQSSNNKIVSKQFGLPTDKPVQGITTATAGATSRCGGHRPECGT